MKAGWLPVADAALARGVSMSTIRDATLDGRIRWRWGRSVNWNRQARIEVWWPDVRACMFICTDSGPVTEGTWARLCEVMDKLTESAALRRGGVAHGHG